MSGGELLVVALAVYLAALIQALSGFGFGLLAVPLMTMAIDTKEAVVVVAIIGSASSGWQAWHERAHTERAMVKRLVISAYLGMPIGLLVFVTVGDETLRLMLGIAVLAAVALLIVKVRLHHLGPRFDYGAGFVSGVLNTSLSTPGPPIVFSLQARGYQPSQFRGTLSWVFVLIDVAGVALFAAAGKVTGDGLLAAAIAVPAMVAGQLSGMPLRHRIAPERFRALVLVLLIGAAISAIIASRG